MKHSKLLSGGLSLLFAVGAMAQSHQMVVNTKKAGTDIPHTMYGLFFEDINYAADGGLYGELVKNRSFEFPQALMGWQSFGNVTLHDDGPFERCPHYVTLTWPGHKDRRSGLQNEGYFGIGIHQGEDYRFTVWARADLGTARIKVQLIDQHTMADDQVLAGTTLEVTSREWKKYEVVLQAPKTEAKANLRIFLDGDKPVSLEHISLFPINTFKNRTNGMRRDLAQALADIHPGVLRFPGGCIVEGEELANRYQWKNTIGPVENRPLNRNRWEFTFEHRFFPDYFQSYGLGFFEYFQLAEDIGAEPLPVLNVGMACQFQNSDDASAHAGLDQLDPYIQDCLDLIEFANGDASTTWGRKRAEMGHEAPFNLKFLAIGNEQWDTLYFQRLKPFVKAVKAKYPDIQIIGSSGPYANGELFDKGWKAMREQKADLVDEHFYCDEEFFLTQGTRYDNYSRKGPKVFAGEYACHGKGKKWNHFEASLYEAAFMTGLERNADLVRMATYAPLFAHVDGWQWRPDMIWYDNTRMMKTTSYYVQQLYARNKGTHTLAMSMNGKPVAGQQGQDGLFASAVVDRHEGVTIIKVINTSNQEQDIDITLQGMKGNKTAQTYTLACDDMDAENTLDRPDRIAPQQGHLDCATGHKGVTTLSDRLSAKTFRLYRIRN